MNRQTHIMPVLRPFLAAVLAVAVLLPGGAVVADAQALAKPNIKMCVLSFANVDDLGWSFSVNVGRLRTKNRLDATFGAAASIETVSFPNAFFAPDKGQLWRDVVSEGCNVVVSIGCCYFDEGFTPYAEWDQRARNYPNISFLIMWDDQTALNNNNHTNLAFFIVDQTPGYYLGGVAAAAQAETCVGILVPFAWNRNSHDAASGFALGVYDTKPTMPVHVMTMEDFYLPGGEIEMANVLIDDFGCEVVARYSDPRDLDVSVQNRAERPRKALSVGSHADLQQYVGDAVLTSVLGRWDNIFYDLVADIIRFGSVQAARKPLVYGVASGVLEVAPVSPAAKPGVQAAVDAAKAAKLSANDDLLCGAAGLPTTFGANTNATYKAGTSCRDPTAQLAGIALTPNAVNQGAYAKKTTCGNGTRAAYVRDGNQIRLNCTVCPPDTFALAGATSCTPCADGLVSPGNASRCQLPAQQTAAESKDATTLIVAVVVPIVVVVIVAAVGVVVAGRMALTKRNKLAPKAAPLTLLFTDIEGSTTLWNQSPEAMGKAIDIHHRTIREVIAAHGAYEVKTVGDAFMIATESALTATTLALDIQSELAKQQWPGELTADAGSREWNGVRVRIGVHRCVEVEAKYEEDKHYWDYYGNDVNIAARVESKAQGGQTLLSEATWEAVQADPQFEAMIGTASASLYARGVTLKGVEGTVALFSVVPMELAARTFHPLEGHEKDADNASSFGGSETASSIANSSIDGAEFTTRSVNGVIYSLFQQMSHDGREKLVSMILRELKLPPNRSQRKAMAAIGTEMCKRMRVQPKSRRRSSISRNENSVDAAVGGGDLFITPGEDAHPNMVPESNDGKAANKYKEENDAN